MPVASRSLLPQLQSGLFITDGGIETTLIFHDGLELPYFAAFNLLKTATGEVALRQYFGTYAAIAEKYRTGLILESATWRASADWGKKLGYSKEELAEANRKAIRLLEEIRNDFKGDRANVVVSGCIGPRGDGYSPGEKMSVDEAEAYHAEQIGIFSDTTANLVTAVTMNYVEEAVGIARAAANAEMPVVISFTVETDGRLPTGQALRDAITQVDESTDGAVSYYMINCAHPTHFDQVLTPKASWLEKIRGIRANASVKSHAELNDSTELDIGDPADLGKRYRGLKHHLPKFNVIGGCCGTDHRHVEEMAKCYLSPF